MRLTHSPSATTAGIGLTAASLLLTVPVAPFPVTSDLANRAIKLAAAFDDLSWSQVIDNASTAWTTNISGPFSGAPFPAIEQVAFNLAGYLGDLYKDIAAGNFTALPATSAAIETAIQDNLASALNAPMVPFDPTGSASYLLPSLSTTPVTVDVGGSIAGIGATGHITIGDHADLLNDLTNGLDINIFGIDFGRIDILSLLLGSSTASEVLPYLDFLGSPLSGVLWGMIGADLSPMAQLLDDGVHIFNALASSTPDYATALADLEAIPANVTNASLVGYGNLGNLLADFGISSGGFQVDLGGLLSPGGSLFNALGFSVSDDLGDCSIACVTVGLTDNATTVGPIASLLEMGQAIAQSIGWDDVGNQLADLASQF